MSKIWTKQTDAYNTEEDRQMLHNIHSGNPFADPIETYKFDKHVQQPRPKTAGIHNDF